MLPATEREIDEFLAAFEGGTLPKARWTHGAHLLTGACYVHALGQTAAIEKMRLCIPRHNVAAGVQNTDTSGYHETITIAWIKLLARLLREVEKPGPIARAAFTAVAVARYESDRNHLQRYYGFDLVTSVEARRAWVPPTLASLD